MKKVFTLLFALLFLTVGMGVTAAEPSLRVVPEAALPGDQVKLIVSGDSLLEKEFCVYVNDAKDRCFESTGLPKFVSKKNNTVTFRVPESAKPGEYSLNVLVKESGSTASRVLSNWLQVNTASAQQELKILEVFGCLKSDTKECKMGLVEQGGILSFQINSSAVSQTDSIQVALGDISLSISNVDEGKGVISAELPVAIPVGDYFINLTYQGMSAQSTVKVVKATDLSVLPDIKVEVPPIGQGKTPPKETDVSPNPVDLNKDLDCSGLGLVLDPATGLCLPADLVKGEQGSLAGSRSVGEVIKVVLNFLLVLAGVIAVLFMMIGGYQYLMSRGSDEMAKKGRSTMTAAIIGLVAVLLAWTVVNIVTNAVTLGTGSLFR